MGLILSSSCPSRKQLQPQQKDHDEPAPGHPQGADRATVRSTACEVSTHSQIYPNDDKDKVIQKANLKNLISSSKKQHKYNNWAKSKMYYNANKQEFSSRG